jgi:hypothetical protein
MNVYEQCEKLVLLAREHKLDAEITPFWRIRIGRKWYDHPLSASVAIISAFDKVGIPIPQELKDRPEGID